MGNTGLEVEKTEEIKIRQTENELKFSDDGFTVSKKMAVKSIFDDFQG